MSAMGCRGPVSRDGTSASFGHATSDGEGSFDEDGHQAKRAKGKGRGRPSYPWISGLCLYRKKDHKPKARELTGGSRADARKGRNGVPVCPKIEQIVVSPEVITQTDGQLGYSMCPTRSGAKSLMSDVAQGRAGGAGCGGAPS